MIVTESLASGLPMLLVDITPGQEEGNADFVVRNGAGQLGPSPIETLEILCHWLDKDKVLLHQYQEKAQRIGRPRSAFTAADLIWSAALEQPSPVIADHLAVLPKLLDLLSSFGIDSGRKPADSKETQRP
jgi:1,2-diacylglycerol 3-beta-galactosyltransferase